MIIIGIDIGHSNLAIVKARICVKTFKILDILHCSLTNLGYIDCNDNTCSFDRHDKSNSHRVFHFFEINKNVIFSDSDYIRIERQPLTGLTGIEQTLFLLLKLEYKKTKNISLISPNALHAFYRMSHDYNTRKQESIKMTFEYLQNNSVYKLAVKKDDLSDACLYVKFFIEKFLPEEIEKKRISNRFSSFAYVKP